jgi:hypothetical protein
MQAGLLKKISTILCALVRAARSILPLTKMLWAEQVKHILIEWFG